MSKKRKIIVVIVIAIMIIGLVDIRPKKENVILDEVKLISNDNIINRKAFAILVEDDNGDYTDYNGEAWPSYDEYRFNPEMSKCTDSEGKETDASLSYDKETESVTVTSNKTVFCKIYFRKKDMVAPIIKEFYVGSHSGTEYTTTEAVKYHIEWTDDDVTEYCITQGTDSTSCNWIPVNSPESIAMTTTEEMALATEHSVEESVNLNDGEREYTFHAYIRDLDENESLVKNDIIFLDKADPKITNVVQDDNLQETTATITVEANDTGSGIARYCYKLSTDDNFTCKNVTDGSANTYTFTNLAAGQKHTINVYVEDKAERRSNQAATYEVETKKSTLTVPESLKDLYKSDTTLLGNSETKNDGYLIYHDGQGYYENAQYEAGDNSFRFSGNNPDNWICMDGTNNTGACDKSKMYRVIGWFPTTTNSNEYKMKIIKSEYITSDELGMTSPGKAKKTTSYVDYTKRVENNTTVDGFYWSGNKNINWNNWRKSKVNQALNDSNGTYLQSLSAYTSLNLIEDTKWYIGGNTATNIYSQSNMKLAYEYELGDNKLTTNDSKCANTNPTEYIQCTDELLYQENKVGLMYATEYGYAASPDNWTTELYYYYKNPKNRSQNWLYNGMEEWTLSRDSSGTKLNHAFYLENTGGINSYTTLYVQKLGIRPVIVISSNVTLSGEGSKEKPWRINLGNGGPVVQQPVE